MKLRALLFALPLLLVAAPASAQLHYDAGLQLGVAKRFLGNKNANGDDAGFGPIGEARIHLALVPLVRVGVYVMHDISPISGTNEGPARQITAGGLHAKIALPFPQATIRPYAGIGFGYVGAYAPSYHAFNVPSSGGSTIDDLLIEGAWGHYFEIPISIGGALKLSRGLDLTAELGARFGFGFGGDLYTDRIGHASSATLGTIDQSVGFPGDDTFATTLTVGLSFDL